MHTQRRIAGVDIFRSIAISFAMLSHTLVVFDFYRMFDSRLLFGTSLLMQTATPAFICMFGAMLELVYTRRFRQGAPEAAIARLLERALQCYLLYVVATLFSLGAGRFSIEYALRCILMMGVKPYTDILKFYALALAFAPVLIALRLRFGLGILLAVAAGLHLLHPLFEMIPAPPHWGGQDYIGTTTRFLIGVGDTIVGGPSVLHGLTFVVFGMVMGRAMAMLLDNDLKTSRRGLLIMAGLIAAGCAVVLSMWDASHNLRMLQEMTDMTWRNANDPRYFALGVATTAVGLTLCVFLFDIRGQTWARGIEFIGRVSLFTFCFGNVLILIQPFRATSPTTSLVLIAIFSALIALQSYVFWRITRSDAQGGAKPFGAFGRLVAHVTARCMEFTRRCAAPFVEPYLRLLGGDRLSRHISAQRESRASA